MYHFNHLKAYNLIHSLCWAIITEAFIYFFPSLQKETPHPSTVTFHSLPAPGIASLLSVPMALPVLDILYK